MNATPPTKLDAERLYAAPAAADVAVFPPACVAEPVPTEYQATVPVAVGSIEIDSPAPSAAAFPATSVIVTLTSEPYVASSTEVALTGAKAIVETPADTLTVKVWYDSEPESEATPEVEASFHTVTR